MITFACALAACAAIVAALAWHTCRSVLGSVTSLSQTSTQRFSFVEKRIAALETAAPTALKGELDALVGELDRLRASNRRELGALWQRVGGREDAAAAQPATRDDLRAQLLRGHHGVPVGGPKGE